MRSVSDLCEGLASQGHDVTVFTTDAGLQPNDLPARGVELVRNAVRIYYYPREKGFGIKSNALESAVRTRAGEFELIHITAIWQRTGPAAAAAARRAQIPYVLSPRGALGPYSWQRGTLKKVAYYFLRERASLRGAAGFHYTSAMEEIECQQFRFGKPYCVVPNGIDLTLWQRDEDAGQQWRERHGIGPEEKVLLYVGRLHDKKGLDLLPAVLARLKEHSWQMVFVGPDDDGTRTQLERDFHYNRLADRVLFLPTVSPAELVPVYSGGNVLLMPSLHENFGNVALEAAACGCRVLASEHTGVARELARIGAGSCLPRIPGAWAQAINQPLGTKNRQSTIESLHRMFAIKNTTIRMQRFYHSIAG